MKSKYQLCELIKKAIWKKMANVKILNMDLESDERFMS